MNMNEPLFVRRSPDSCVLLTRAQVFEAWSMMYTEPVSVVTRVDAIFKVAIRSGVLTRDAKVGACRTPRTNWR